MLAWRIHEHGDPADVLRLEDAPEPVAGPGEVLVRVEAAALNYPDVLVCQGKYQDRAPLPLVPGFEVAGVADGRRVAAMCVFPNGGLAEYTVVPAEAALPIPDDLAATDAAAMVVTFRTAHAALHRRAGLRAGETLLVHGGAGGVGSATIQLGKAAGARVIAVAGGASKVAVCAELGADVVIDHEREDFVTAVLDATGGRGADVVVDPVGGDVFDRSRKVVAFEGRLVVTGFAGGPPAQAPTNHALVKNYSIVGVHLGLYRHRAPQVIAEIHADLMRLGVRPLVSEVLTMAQVPDAVKRIYARSTVGKLVVTVP